MTPQHYIKDVVTIPASADVREAADRLEGEGVGCAVVLDEAQHPVGVVTDRDLALRVVAAGRDPGETRVEAVMSRPLVSVEADAPLSTVIERMSAHGIRRLPVLRDGALVGMASLDDLIVKLGQELDALGEATRRQFRSAQRTARAQKLREELESRFEGLVEQLEFIGGNTKEALSREFGALRERLRRMRN